jgi:hypothetical protein
MSKIFVCIVIFIFNANILAQTYLLDGCKNNPNYEVKILEDSTVEIYDKASNFRWKKNITQYPKYESSKQANLTIWLDTIDFSRYQNYYRDWGSIPAVNSFGKYNAIDANRNGKLETYVYFPNNKPSGGYFEKGTIYEQVIDSSYSNVYIFQDSLGSSYDIGDITDDGNLDLMAGGYDQQVKFYKQSTTTSLINSINFIYQPFPNPFQFNTPTFYDIDNDGVLEIVYYLDAGTVDSIWAASNHVARFNPQLNNYELIYYHRPYPDFYTYGISIGDFDQDGKGNFGTGSINGKFYIYEYVQGNQFKVEFQDTLPTSNAFFSTFTDDMDGNGKPEVWVGGDYAGMTRLFAYEANSPGNYEQVYQIDIIGLSALFYGKLKYIDLDFDGEKELFLQNANVFFCFKYDSNGNYYMDFAWFTSMPDTSYMYIVLERVDVADLDGDGVGEIITQCKLSNSWPMSLVYRSYFQKRNRLTDIEYEDNFLPAEFNLFQNYHNPFNPVTNIKFALPFMSNISIKIYSTLGKEIKELINETRFGGEYEITWDGTDNNNNKVSSGVYFITMEANSFTQNSLSFRKTIKSILLK